MQPLDVLQSPRLIQHRGLHSVHLVILDGIGIAGDEVVAELLVERADPGVLLVSGRDLVHFVFEFFQSFNFRNNKKIKLCRI